MNEYEKQLAAELLELAADEFSNHGCNDFKRPAWFPEREWDAMHRRMYEQNGDPQNFESSDYGFDWWLMRYLSRAILKEPT